MEEEKIKEQPLQNKMDEAEQEFKLSKADNTAKELENRKSKTNKFGYFFCCSQLLCLL